jgi:hypothetical protein
MFLIKDCTNDWDNFFKPEGWVGTKLFTSKFLLLRLVSWKFREELADVIVKQQLHARTPPPHVSKRPNVDWTLYYVPS